MSVNSKYETLIRDVMEYGSTITTRNSVCKRLTAVQIVFTSFPLVSIRKTAWKSALREWEWFMSGSNRITDLHPSVRHWWEPFCKVDGETLCYNYSKSFRKIYTSDHGKPVTIQPKLKSTDEPVEVPVFPKLEVKRVEGKWVGYEGVNTQGDTFRVVDHDGDGYRIQFGSNGYCVVTKATNFLKGVIKNPYYPSVLGVGCHGVIDADKYTYKHKAYRVWTSMMNRCYNTERRSYKWYGAAGVTVCGRWKCFANFLSDVPGIPGFEEWLLSDGGYHLDKDYNKANYYGPDVCVFLAGAVNTALASAEKVYDVPRRELHVDQISYLVDGIRDHPYSRRNVITTWIPGHVESGLMEPTNCHGTVVQAFVQPDNRLDLVTYQRSADLVCGVPHNWAQYWAFLVWLASVGKREVGSLTWVGGDVHVYEEHFALAERMLAVDAPSPPALLYEANEVFRAADFTLDGEYRYVLSDRAKMIV